MIFGKYQLLELLGRGGMAEVFKAKSYGVEGFEKLLVIKRILPTLTDNERFVDMFINEAKIAVSLNHANIVQVFDLGKVGDSYYIAMEYVQGQDMSTFIKRCETLGRSVPLELAAYIGSEVAKGLDYAHRRRGQNLEPLNIIHRDISPHNVLLSYEGEVKITDFGIAKAKTTLSEEEPGSVKGKYAYMAPEQALAKPHDRRVDIFALGVVLYEAITSINPFRGLKAAEVIHKIQSRTYPPLKDTPFGQNAPQEICDIVAKAMAPNPAERFRDAGELYEALISFLYTIGARVGAHSVASFLQETRVTEEEEKRSREGEAENLVAALGGGATAATNTSQAGLELPAEITSVQVPAPTAGEHTTTTTGTRSLAAEMRDVTVVAVEMIGPTPPKDSVRKLAEVLVEGGGVVVEERGDLLVALYGVDVADGRDTQDAINAALKLQRILPTVTEGTPGAKLQIGIGVHPDKIVVGGGSRPREDDAYFKALAAGRELAKRGVGWVCTSSAGRDLAQGSFFFEEVTTVAVGGVDLSVFKISGRRPVAESYGRLFGRRDELRQIGELLASVSRGAGQVLALIGDAGTGKTRILHEVQRRLLAGGHEIGWHEATCVPWRNATPYSAVASMFRSILALSEIEPEGELKLKLERLRELGLIPEEVQAVSVLLGASKDLATGPEERGRQLRSSLIRAATSLAADRLTIFFWDDLQYIDKESLEILHHLSRSIGQVSVMIALGLRTGFAHGWEGDPQCAEIQLGPLSESDSKRLAISRLDVKKAPDDLLMDVALKSDGNPLYIEEYIKTLLANGAVVVEGDQVTYNPDSALVDVPKTLRGLVSARVKRLPADQKGLLQRAAVMGQRFNVTLLGRVTGVPLADLKPMLFGLKEIGLLNRISANEFSFASDLVRDIVYQGIVLSDRREIHISIAAAIESTFADRIDEFVERLAVHYREGGDRNKAVDYLIRAGEKVASDYSHRSALDYYLKALDLLHNVPHPDTRRILSLYLPIGALAVKTNMIAMGIEKMRLAEELAEELGDKRSLVEILRITAELQARSDHFASQQYFQHAIELADEIGDQGLRAEVRATAGEVYIILGDMKKAELYYREATDLWPPEADPNRKVVSLSQLAKALGNSGNHEGAIAAIQAAERLVNPGLAPETRCIFERCQAQVWYMARDIERSIMISQKALEIAKEYDLKEQIAANAHNIGDDYVQLGDYRKAFSYLRMSQEVAQEIGYDIVVNLNNIFLAFIDALKFGSNDGLTQLEHALTVANERNTVWEQVQVHYFLGRIHFERKKYDLAKEHLDLSVRIGRAADNRIYDAPASDLLEQIAELGEAT
ncbi:MAG: protein kinase [Proteobacteria bacterium]|nr:protein kinase [Pseudomonadota bacterium]